MNKIKDDTFAFEELKAMSNEHVRQYYCDGFDYGDDNQYCSNAGEYCDIRCLFLPELKNMRV